MPALMRVALAATVVFAIPTLALAGEKTFPDSVDVLDNGQARFPLYEGVRDGETVYFLIVESSEDDEADEYGVEQINKLENAKNTGAVQHVTFDGQGRIVFPASVDFSPERIVQGNPDTGFPPLAAQPGAVGEEGYSPLIQLPNGTVLNAPQVMNSSGRSRWMPRCRRPVSRMSPPCGHRGSCPPRGAGLHPMCIRGR